MNLQVVIRVDSPHVTRVTKGTNRQDQKVFIALAVERYMGKTMIILALFIVISVCVPVLVYKAGNAPEPTGKVSGEIDTSYEPVQELYSGEKFPHVVEEVQFMIEPVATYEIAFVVLSARYHYSSLEDKLSPVDLCVVWGKLAEPENLEHIYSLQAARWCSYRYDGGLSLDAAYVESHVANIHIIPANENVLKAVKSIKKDQEAVLEGFLVKVYREGRLIWSSSLTRTDSGDGACEVFYVTKVRIGTAIYE